MLVRTVKCPNLQIAPSAVHTWMRRWPSWESPCRIFALPPPDGRRTTARPLARSGQSAGVRYQKRREPNNPTVVRSSRCLAPRAAPAQAAAAPMASVAATRKAAISVALRALSAVSRAFCSAAFSSVKASSTRSQRRPGHPGALADQACEIGAIPGIELRVLHVGREGPRDRRGDVGAVWLGRPGACRGSGTRRRREQAIDGKVGRLHRQLQHSPLCRIDAAPAVPAAATAVVAPTAVLTTPAMPEAASAAPSTTPSAHTPKPWPPSRKFRSSRSVVQGVRMRPAR